MTISITTQMYDIFMLIEYENNNIIIYCNYYLVYVVLSEYQVLLAYTFIIICNSL